MNKQEFIDRVVHSRKGAWPLNVDSLAFNNNATGESMWIPKEEFQQRARDLGYVNGYRFGIEYPTNGKKPDLPDDVLVTVIGINGMANKEMSADNVDFLFVRTFKITDTRYKPADTSYFDKTEQSEPKYLGDIGKSSGSFCFAGDIGKCSDLPETDKGSWFDYTNQKALRLPPVGAEFESYWPKDTKPSWNAGVVAYSSKEHVILKFDDGEENCYFPAVLEKQKPQFRPADWNRKAEAERKQIIDYFYRKYPCDVDEGGMKLLEILYDAGALRMPEGK